MGGTLNQVRSGLALASLLAVLALAGCADTPGFVGLTTSDTSTTATASAGSVLPATPDQLTDEQQQLAVIEHPTKADLAVVGPLGDRSLGNPNAPVTVIEYASLTCPYCRRFHTEMFDQVKKAYIDTGKVHWILREFPIGHTSGAAWIVNRCAPEKDYFKLYDTFMRNQAEWVSLEVRPDVIARVAAKAGMDRKGFDACWQNPETDKALRWVKARARQLGVSGTPTFFIGTTKIRAVPSFAEFSEMVEAETRQPGSSLQVAMDKKLVLIPKL
jgi:protein-disulfide isomerase